VTSQKEQFNSASRTSESRYANVQWERCAISTRSSEVIK